MKRLLVVIAVVAACGAAIAGYQAMWLTAEPALPWPETRLYFDRAEIEFAPTLVGVPTVTSVVATNYDDKPVTLEAFRSAGSFRPLQGKVQIGAGEAVMLSFEFLPDHPGAHEAELFAETATDRVGALTLRGFAEFPAEISIEPRALDFGPVVVGEQRWTPLVIHNRGDGLLEISSLASVGRFEWSETSLSIAAGGRATVEVGFAPARAGSSEAQLVARSNDPVRPALGVAVRGVGADDGVSPSIEITPSRLAFGKVAPGRSARKWVEIRNLSSDPLTITSVLVDGPIKMATRSRTIAPRGFVKLPVTLLPQAVAGTVAASVSIFSNDPSAGVVAVEVVAEVDLAAKEVTTGPGGAVASGGDSAPWYAGTPFESLFGAEGGSGASGNASAEPAIAGNSDVAPSDPGPETGVAAGGLSIDEGSYVNLGSYQETLGSPNLGGATYDAAAGTITFEGLQLPNVNAALGEHYSFSAADVVAQVSEGGEVNATVPVEIFDEFGNGTVVQVSFTTDTATAEFDGTEVAISGSPLGADGTMTLVALEMVPDGALEGQSLQLMMNVQVE